MPEPLAGSVQPVRNASNTFALSVMPVWDIPKSNVQGITGVPAALKGSIMYPAVYSFGVLHVRTGHDTRGGTRGALRVARGNSDTRGRKIR